MKFSLFLSAPLLLAWPLGASPELIYTPYTITTLASTKPFAVHNTMTEPRGIAVDHSGNVFVTDSSPTSAIYMVSPQGEISIIAGGNPNGYDGTNEEAGFDQPTGVTIDGDGNLFVVDTATSAVRKIAPAGTNWVVTTLSRSFTQPQGIAVDGAGVLYIADTGSSTIRMMVPDGTNWDISTIAGLAGQTGSTDGTNETARFYEPVSVTVDRQGSLYVVDGLNTLLRKVAPVGTNWVVTTLFGPHGESRPSDGTNSITPITINPLSTLAVDSAGNFYTAGYFSIQRVTPFGNDWIGTTLIGGGGEGELKDGTGPQGQVNTPGGITVDAAGNLYIADTGNQAIRMARPALQFAATNSQFILSWPTTPPGGYELQSSGNLGPAATWTPLTNGVVTNGVDFVLTNDIDPNAAGRFFRILQP